MANEYQINQINAEAWATFPVSAQVNQISAESWGTYPVDAQVSQLTLEVWRSVDDVAALGRRRQAANIN